MTEAPRTSRRPSLVVGVFVAVLLVDLFFLWVALKGGFSDGDAAGNAMGNAFRQLFIAAAGLATAVLAVLFVVLRRPAARAVITGILGVTTLLLVPLLF